MSSKEIFFLSGLPRSGSTLLSSILNQNPELHSEGNSALCQIIWDINTSCDINCYQQLQANRKYYLKNSLIESAISLYYKDINKKYILDKCRSWTIDDNLKMIKNHITQSPKVIVMVRPIEDILKSFIFLYQKNGYFLSEQDIQKLLSEGSEPIMRSYEGIINIQGRKEISPLYINYDDLISNTNKVLSSIYSYLKVDSFNHDLNNIINSTPEDDSIYGLNGYHSVRRTINKNKNDINIPKYILEYCHYLNSKLFILNKS